MKTKLQKFCKATGVSMLLLTAGLGETENVTALMLWIVATIAMLYIGKSFSFQQK